MVHCTAFEPWSFVDSVIADGAIAVVAGAVARQCEAAGDRLSVLVAFSAGVIWCPGVGETAAMKDGLPRIVDEIACRGCMNERHIAPALAARCRSFVYELEIWHACPRARAMCR